MHRERIEFDYATKFIEFAAKVRAGDADRAGPVEVWKGIAPALQIALDCRLYCKPQSWCYRKTAKLTPVSITRKSALRILAFL
jgi:hypothetical protein